jgi:cyclic pyranopterin phosphate synthase
LTDANADNLGSMPKMSEAVPVMQEAFRVGQELGMTIRSLHVPRCLLGEAAPHAFDPGSQRVMVVTPDASFELHESRLTPQSHVPACKGCEYEAICPGLRSDYLERYGDAEIAAARGVPASQPPTRHLEIRT